MINKSKMNPKEIAVLDVICRGKCTQIDIVRSVEWLGCYERFEATKVADKEQSTTRKVRSVVKDLRMKHNVPILSDHNGYWLWDGDNREEVKEFMEGFEAAARAEAVSRMVTYHHLSKLFYHQLNNDFLSGSQFKIDFNNPD